MRFIYTSPTERVALRAVSSIRRDGITIAVVGLFGTHYNTPANYKVGADAMVEHAQSEMERLLEWAANGEGNFRFNVLEAKADAPVAFEDVSTDFRAPAPACPACKSNARVTPSPKESAFRGAWFCPCNEPRPMRGCGESGHFDEPGIEIVHVRTV